MATIDQLYALKAAAQRCIDATEAITLTNNSSTTLASRLATAESDLVAALAAAGAGGSGTTAIVANAQTLAVKNSAGTVIDAAAVATVAGGAVSGVALASTKAGITSGTKITATVTGTGTTGVTPTIVNGVVTGLVLS